MTAEMRDMINQLMGSNRAEEEGRQLVPYNHHSVCRAFLLGCCPHEILADTRLESFVACHKVHESAHKADYENAQKEKDHFYDVDVFERLEEAIRVVDKEIERTKDKLKRDCENEVDQAEVLKTQKIGELGEKIGTTIVKMEALGNEGKVDEAMELSKTIEELKKKKKDLENDMRTVLNTPQVRLRVCEMCSAQLSIMEHETRLADHYGGKMHVGMEMIRERYEQMKKTIDERRAAWRKARLSGIPPLTRDADRSERDKRDRERDYRDSRDTKDYRDSRDSRDARDSREYRDSRDSRDYRDSRDSREDRRRSFSALSLVALICVIFDIFRVLDDQSIASATSITFSAFITRSRLFTKRRLRPRFFTTIREGPVSVFCEGKHESIRLPVRYAIVVHSQVLVRCTTACRILIYSFAFWAFWRG
uniref:Luc7-like protein 3 n=1 Tax=Ascaris suum TaxID=6253 RepID=F1KQI7_ASCSU